MTLQIGACMSDTDTKFPERPPLEDVCWVIKGIAEFIQDGGGSFRKMMEYLELEPRHYQDMYQAGGMLVSNTIHDGLKIGALHDPPETEI